MRKGNSIYARAALRLLVLCSSTGVCWSSEQAATLSDDLYQQTLSLFNDGRARDVTAMLDALDSSYRGEYTLEALKFFTRNKVKSAMLYGLLVGHDGVQMQAARFLQRHGSAEDIEMLMFAFEEDNVWMGGGTEGEESKIALLASLRDAIGAISETDLSDIDVFPGDRSALDRIVKRVAGERDEADVAVDSLVSTYWEPTYEETPRKSSVEAPTEPDGTGSLRSERPVGIAEGEEAQPMNLPLVTGLAILGSLLFGSGFALGKRRG